MRRSRPFALLLLPLLATWAVAGGKEEGRFTSAKEKFLATPEHMVDLTDETFNSTMAGLPQDRWVVVQFFAHWCPHCQHFGPEYQRLAAFFAARGNQEPVVMVARHNCAKQPKTCKALRLHRFPSLHLGRALDFASLDVGRIPKLRPAQRGRLKADGVLAAIGKILDVDFGTMRPSDEGVGAAGDGVTSFEGQGSYAEGGPPRYELSADLNDIEGATSLSWDYITSSALLKGPAARQALTDWIALLAGQHPVDRCRQGAGQVQEALARLWPGGLDEPQEELGELEICPGSEFQDWRSCRGSTPESRGYTCGLWQLLHSLAAQLPDEVGAGATWLVAVKGFIGNYFQCGPCAEHFLRHASKPEAVVVNRKRDAVMWMWRAHNTVNQRLAVMERRHRSKTDPLARKVQFPPAVLCRECRKREGRPSTKHEAVPWEDDAVYRFLLAYYSSEQALEAQPTLGLAEAAVHAAPSWTSGWGDARLLFFSLLLLFFFFLRCKLHNSRRCSDSKTHSD